MTVRPIALAIGAAVLACAGCGSTPTPPPASGTSASNGATASSGPAPGQWQLVLEVDDLPGTGKVPPQTLTMCSTPEDKKQWQDMVGGKSMAGCTIKDYTASGATISYTMQCGGGIEGRTTIRIADVDRYSGESTLMLQGGPTPAVIRSKVAATRLSPVCKK
jgi:hypothetical protein